MDDSRYPQNNPDNEPLLNHEYDGIREADNPLPRWWVNMLWATIVFGIIYFPVVHMFDFLPHHELSNSVATAAKIAEAREMELEASGALDKDPIASGKKYFGIFCSTCHGSNAEGGLCPNLTDNFWIHGPYEKDITQTIAGGVPTKGMPAWGPVLGDRKIRLISTYVASLWQTPPVVSGKKSEGVEYDMALIRKPKPSVASEADTAKTTTTPQKKSV